mgnify:CR=1 FL=1
MSSSTCSAPTGGLNVKSAAVNLGATFQSENATVYVTVAFIGAAGEAVPDVLVMTATPIPRTVAMTVFGDLEVSTLTELPKGRAPITTHVVPAAEKPAFLERAWERIVEEVGKGRQAYVVFPRIGGDKATANIVQAAAADAEFSADGGQRHDRRAM